MLPRCERTGGSALKHAFFGLFIISTAIFIGAPAMASSDPRYSLDRAGLEKTCAHYTNRARFMIRDADAPIEVFVAESCAVALKRLTTSHTISPYEAKRARIYLERLTAYKRLIISMNVARFAKTRATPMQDAPFGATRRTVSRAGEYLIARHMGLFDVFDDWASVANYTSPIKLAGR